MMMLKKLLREFLCFFRRLLGTEQIQQQLRWQQQQQQWRQQQMLLTLGNTLKYSLMNPEKVKSTTTYRRCAEIVSLLSPMDIDSGRYVRVGKDYDGGYVMLDNFQREMVDAAYSFGISDDVSWDEYIAKSGIEV
jgi:hypothetical protein